MAEGVLRWNCRRHGGHCRRYALEAIIIVIIYLNVHNYVYIPCYNCNGSRVYNNHDARRKTHVHVWNNKRKIDS